MTEVDQAPPIPGISDLSEVARGGFATIYQGRQSALERPVAVKVMDAPADAAGASRFRRELLAVGSLSGHPHVVAVYDAGEVYGRPYMVMPYLAAGSLQDRLAATGPLPAAEARRMATDIADALVAAHHRGILHRDVKPGNVLISPTGDFQLGDFGIARFVDATVTNGPLAATVTYAAPEVLAGEPATALSDVYSLGATTYAALAGRPPFRAGDGESAIALGLRVIHDEPSDLVAMGVPPALARVVKEAMAKNPAHRPGSAAALREAFAGVDLEPEPEPTPPAPVAGERRAKRRHRAPLALGAAGALVVAGAATAAALAYPGSGSGNRAAGGVTAGPPPASTTRRHTGAGSRAGDSSSPATTSSTASTASPPTTAPGQPPLAGSFSPATLTKTVNEYYAIVNRHDLTESFRWLSPAYQGRIGWAYYQQFWGSISRVDVLSVTPGNKSAALGLKFYERNGATSTEHDAMTFTEDPRTGRILIDSYRVT